jgi:hypothetical protein
MVTVVVVPEWDVATVHWEVEAEVTTTAAPDEEESVCVMVGFEVSSAVLLIWSPIAEKLITFAWPTVMVGSMYMLEPRNFPPLAS